MIPPRHDQVQLEPWERRALEAMERSYHLDGGTPAQPPPPAPGVLPGAVTPRPMPPTRDAEDTGQGSLGRLVRWFLGRS
ncbi:MAG: hypothetical protein AB7O92_29170 [Acidimicrobiia bacterium]